MAHTYHTTFTVEYQQYYCKNSEKFENEKRILEFHSKQTSAEASCPLCGGIRKSRLPDYRTFRGARRCMKSISTDMSARIAGTHFARVIRSELRG